jgi:hypothetical protein
MFELADLHLRLQAELGRVRAIGSDASAEEWVELAGSCQQLLNVIAAVQTVALAHVAATEDVVREDGTIEEEFRGLGHQRLDAPALVQDRLGLTASGATDRVAIAVDLVTRHPALVEAMAAGRLDAYRAGIVAEELVDATPEVCAEVADKIGSRLGTEAGGALRRRTRRALASVDPDLVRRKAERARAERSLRRSAFAPGVDEWSAKVPVEESRSAWSVVDGLARSYVTDGRCAGIEQARADALMDLIHARATGEVTVHLTVPASAVASEAAAVQAAHAERAASDAGVAPGPSEDAAELVPVTGFGMPGVTHVRASWVASVARPRMPRGRGNGPPASVDVVACDDTSGALTSLPMGAQRKAGRRRDLPTADPGRYRPPQWMIEFVKARDGQCRFPGCAISARFCDVDHVVPWPVGATDPTNLVCLCRRHHRIKQRPRWRARLDADGTLVWTDPTGHESTTLPLDHLQGEEVAAPPPVVATSRTESGSESELPAELGPSASELAGELPSVLEEAFEHLTEGVLVELACHPRTLTAHNRRALRTGQRIDICRIERVSTRGCSRVEIVRVRDRLDVDELLFRRHRHRHRSSSRRIRGLSSDDPPPF